MPAKPLVLLTNDDGYGATGLNELDAALRRRGLHVLVIAPDRNHTASSHRVTLAREVSLNSRRSGQYACSGTPADCVRLGVLSGLTRRPDLVMSGINHGANAGQDIHYSGTVSAAVEAAMLGIPAVAVSKDGGGGRIPFLAVEEPSDFSGADLAVEIALWAYGQGFPKSTLLSINLPMTLAPAPAARWCRLGRRAWSDARASVLSRDDAEILIDPWSMAPDAIDDPESDFAALKDGFASVNVLSAANGLLDALEEFPAWTQSGPPHLFSER